MRFLKLIVLMMVMTITASGISAEKEVNGVPYVQLNNGEWMPRFGIGTFNVPGDSTAADAVTAIDQALQGMEMSEVFGGSEIISGEKLAEEK